jgi:uncharacterized protein YeaO (DUF488 family)
VKIEVYFLEIAKYTNGKNVLVVWWWCRGVGCTEFDRDCNLHFKHIIFCETEIFKCANIKKKSYDMFEDTKWSNQSKDVHRRTDNNETDNSE